MPIPHFVPQKKIKVNGQRATDMGGTPKVVKMWRNPPPTKQEDVEKEKQ